MKLNDEELERYKRQMSLEGFGENAQRKLKQGTALVAGVGGLGGTAAMYLAAAGIGRLIILHEGRLTLSNLNRQILMTSDRIGKPRVAKAKETLTSLNPNVEVLAFDEPVSVENLKRLMPAAGVVLDCRHNFHERRVLNEAAVKFKKPMIEAAINGMEGYLFNIFPGKTPCLHCLYPEDPAWEPYKFPVLGAVSGTLGCLSAIEAVKILAGNARPIETMLYADFGAMKFKSFKIHRQKDCVICGLSHLRDIPASALRQASVSAESTCR